MQPPDSLSNPTEADPERAAEPVGDAPTSGWTPPISDVTSSPAAPVRPRSTASRVAEAVVWILGGAVVLFLGRIAALFNPDLHLTAFEQGEVIGGVVGALLFAAVIRWAWVAKVRPGGRVRSPWILLIAVALLGINLSSHIAPASSAAAPTPPPARLPVTAFLVVTDPYTIGPAPADITKTFTDGFAAMHPESLEVRQISSNGTPVAYLIVGNIGTTTDGEYLQGLEAGFEKTAGNDAHVEAVLGHDVVVGSGTDRGMMAWAEPPYALIVYTLDLATAKEIGGAVIAAYK